MATKTTQSFDLYLETLFELYESTSYSETRKSLELALDKITNKLIKDGDVTEWSKIKLNEYKKLIDEEIGNSYGGLFKKISDESVAVAGVTAGAYGMNKLPTRTIKDLINTKRQIQGYDFREIFKVTEENQKRALRTLLASEVAMGTPPTEIAKMLKDKGSSLTRSQLNTSVFTTLSESRERARYEAYKELEKEIPLKYEYVATLDSRVSGYCRIHDGIVYDTLDEIQRDLNSHFNCRSTKASIADENDIPSTRASMFGETQNLPYKDWVKTLNDEQLRIILGRKYNAYKNGTYTIGGLADVKQAGVKLNLRDVKNSINLGKQGNIN